MQPLLDVHSAGREHEELVERLGALDAALLGLAGGRDDQAIGQVDGEDGVRAPDHQVASPGHHHERTQEATRTGELEARVEAVLVRRATFELGVRRDDRLDAARQRFEVRRGLRLRPDLVPAQHEDARPPQPRVAPHRAHDLEAAALDHARVEEHHGRVESMGALEPIDAHVGHGDRRAVIAERGGEPVGAPRIVVHHEHTQPGEDLQVAIGIDLVVEEAKSTPRCLEELVAERLGLGDQSLQVADELVERARDTLPWTEHQTDGCLLVGVRPLDREDPGAQLLTDEIDELVEGRLTERTLRFPGTVRQLDAEIGDAVGDLVDARRARDDRHRAAAERAEPFVERCVRLEQSNWDHGGRRVRGELREHLAAAILHGVAHQHHQVRRGDRSGGHQVGARRRLDGHFPPLERLTDRVGERLTVAGEQKGGSGFLGQGRAVCQWSPKTPHPGQFRPIRGRGWTGDNQ